MNCRQKAQPKGRIVFRQTIKEVHDERNNQLSGAILVVVSADCVSGDCDMVRV
jgi:hypothetical protein